jgi:hypothetical protein
MDTVEQIRLLRKRLINLNQAYLDGMREGKTLAELQEVNREMGALVDLIQSPEKSLPDGDDRDKTWL